MSPVIGVLALQGDVAEHLRAVTESGARGLPVRRPEELSGVDGLIIPGGESTTMWKLAAAFELMDPLRKLVSSGLPVFGSCAGMIMLAGTVLDRIAGQALGGQSKVEFAPDGIVWRLDVPALAALKRNEDLPMQG